jgi:hypothetical protein
LNQSAPTPLQGTWNVSCSGPSNHQLTGNASIVIDQLHLTDSTPGNNSGNGNDSTAINATTDLKVSGVSVNAPPSASTGATFPVTVTATLHNNSGTSPAQADGTIGLSGPGDCTLTPTGGQTINNAGLLTSAAQNFNATWNVSCTGPSNHQFDGSATVTVDQQHLTDSTPGNNSGGGSDTASITATADVKTTDTNLTIPPIMLNVPFDVEIDGSVHNNGGFGPVSSTVTVTLGLPADCTTGDTNPVVLNNVNLAASVASAVGPETWSVTCTQAVEHVFCATIAVAYTLQHVSDPTSGNNSSQVCISDSSTPPPTPPPGGTPNPVGGIAGLLESGDGGSAIPSETTSTGETWLMTALAIAGAVAVALAAAWVTRRMRDP